jgi:hypothetical protein
MSTAAVVIARAAVLWWTSKCLGRKTLILTVPIPKTACRILSRSYGSNSVRCYCFKLRHHSGPRLSHIHHQCCCLHRCTAMHRRVHELEMLIPHSCCVLLYNSLECYTKSVDFDIVMVGGRREHFLFTLPLPCPWLPPREHPNPTPTLQLHVSRPSN